MLFQAFSCERRHNVVRLQYNSMEISFDTFKTFNEKWLKL